MYPYYGRYGYLEMTIFLMLNIILLYRLFSSMLTISGGGLVFTNRNYVPYLWRCVLAARVGGEGYLYFSWVVA
jgi:hypothetical protein